MCVPTVYTNKINFFFSEPKMRPGAIASYISLFWLPEQSTMDWVAQTMKFYFLGVLGPENPKSQAGLLVGRFASPGGLSLWPADGCLPTVSSQALFSVYTFLMPLPLFIKDTGQELPCWSSG